MTASDGRKASSAGFLSFFTSLARKKKKRFTAVDVLQQSHSCSPNLTTMSTAVVSGHVTGTNCVFSCAYSLGSAEGHLKVLPAVAGAQGAVVKRFREEIMHQGTKCHAVTPAG